MTGQEKSDLIRQVTV